ncbi:MAG: hypothetical protein NT062_07180 [Proteobacteria bacterium]|nr:hypothetical protein [Pseudomonadota bacterium]
MSRLAVALGIGVIIAATASAHAERIILADPDPELRRALTTALAPWHAEIVVGERDAPAARFVVWRQGDELVVLDRERATTARRASHAGPLDAVSAAEAALTVKTMLNLPPLAGAPPPPPPPPPTTPTTSTMRALRIELGVDGRLAFADDRVPGARAVLAAKLRPDTSRGWRVGLVAELGTASTIERSGFAGTWGDWSAAAIGSWSIARAAWELEPYVTLGVTRSTLEGTEANRTRVEHATLFAIGGGATVWRTLAPVRVGIVLGMQGTPGTPTYTRTTMGMGTPTIFQVPAITVGLGIVVGVDLGL